MTARRVLTAALLLFVAASVATLVGKVRCSSCRRIEQISRKTIEEAFRQELAEGRLHFFVVNVDQPGNRHYVEEYRLESSSLVLAEIQNGKPARWKNLSDVWTLVDDPPKPESYVRNQVAAMMRGI